ncbi:MAG: hypothetical protein RBJ76_15255 [Stenomitos frigidus ULC029]
MGWYAEAKDWASEGKCTNKTDKDIQVCMGQPGKPHQVRTLKPGESTLPGEDCDGIMRDTGGITKIHGRFGWTSEHDSKWVNKNWKECAEYIISTNKKVGGTTSNFMPPGISYAVLSEAHKVWDWTPEMPNGWFAGSRGLSAPIDGIKIGVRSSEISIKFYCHSASGFESWSDGGTVIYGNRASIGIDFIDAFSIQLTRGNDKYDIIYKVHVQGLGDSAFFGNGVAVGVQGKRIEGILIGIVPRLYPPAPAPAPVNPPDPFVRIHNNYRTESIEEVILPSGERLIESDYRLSNLKESVEIIESPLTGSCKKFPIFNQDISLEETSNKFPIFIPDLSITENISATSYQVKL